MGPGGGEGHSSSAARTPGGGRAMVVVGLAEGIAIYGPIIAVILIGRT
jgi:F0F1-type ATP synthase membrane subunit c/vacuolar-type H+-ATPase subunit K